MTGNLSSAKKARP